MTFQECQPICPRHDVPSCFGHGQWLGSPDVRRVRLPVIRRLGGILPTVHGQCNHKVTYFLSRRGSVIICGPRREYPSTDPARKSVTWIARVAHQYMRGAHVCFIFAHTL